MPYFSVPLFDDLERRVGIRHSDLGHDAQGSHQSNLKAETRSPPLHTVSAALDRNLFSHWIKPKTHQRHSEPVPVTHRRTHDCLIDPHPAREHSRRRQPRAHAPICNQEHLGGPRVLRKISLLDPDRRQDHDAEEHAQPDEQPVGCTLRDEL